MDGLSCALHLGLSRAVHLVRIMQKEKAAPGELCDNMMQKGQSLVVMLSGIGLLHFGGLCGTSKPLATSKSTSLVHH